MEGGNLKISAGGRLDINRDSEVLNQFVRINIDETATDGDKRVPLTTFVPQKPEPPGIIKGVGNKSAKDEKKVEFDEQQQTKLQQEKQQQQQDGQPEPEKQEASAEEKQEQDESAAEKEKPKKKINQKEIKEELKTRRKKRKRPRPEEIYTDKDRAAAVNMGTRDIKQSLKIKRRQDRSRALQIPEEADPAAFLALGNFEMTKGGPAVALGFFHKVVFIHVYQ